MPNLVTFISFSNVIALDSLTPSNIPCRDSNKQPLSWESSPLTARPQLSPSLSFFYFSLLLKFCYFSFAQKQENGLRQLLPEAFATEIETAEVEAMEVEAAVVDTALVEAAEQFSDMGIELGCI